MDNPLSLLSNIFEAGYNLFDDLHTSDEEKQKGKIEFTRVQNEITKLVLGLEAQKLESQTQVIVAEAKGESWLQRSWRPITMLVFVTLVVLDSFGWLANPLAEEAWLLLQLGIGGYVISRGAEKVIPKIMSK